MLDRLISWILAVLTALMGNFGFYEREPTYYREDATYTIQEDPVNYAEMRQWYYDGIKGDDTICEVKSYPHVVKTTMAGFAHIVADTELNVNARLSFSEDDIIIAPRKCKVTTSPFESSEKIIVESLNETSNLRWKLEINNPKAWFCCQDTEPLADGSYKHSTTDHKIELNQGDAIAIADTDTTITMYAVNADGNLGKTDSYAEFLHATSKEGTGSSDVNLGGDEEDVDVALKGSVAKPDIDIDKVWVGGGTWHLAADGSRWWYGTDGAGTPGVDWASDQYVVLEEDEGRIYYIDAEGYCVTGWGPDGYYYALSYMPETEPYEFKQGQLMYNTVVPAPENDGTYVALDANGNIIEGTPDSGIVEVGSVSYYWDDVIGRYRISGSYQSTDVVKNQGSQNIYTQEEGTVLNAEQIDMLQHGEYIGSEYSGWYKTEDDDWMYVESGYLRVGEDFNTTGSIYKKVIGGVLYIFDASDGTLIDNGVSIEEDSNGVLYLFQGDLGARPGWYLDETVWYYTQPDFTLAHSGWLQIDGVWYYFGADGQLAVDTVIDGYYVDTNGAWIQ